MDPQSSTPQMNCGYSDGANRLEVALPQLSLTLFDDIRAMALVTTMADAPDFMEELGRLRYFCFAGTAATTTEPYGLDEYDRYYKQLVVVDKVRWAVVGGMRLGLGDEIVDSHGCEALYTARYWVYLDTMIEVARRGVEIGRVWVHPGYQKHLWGLSLLWKALATFLDRPSLGSQRYEFLFGSAPLSGYPRESGEMIMNYLWRYHRGSASLVRPRQPASLSGCDRYAAKHEGVSSSQALRNLASALETIDPQYPVPVLLRHYINLGAELAGEFAWDPQGNRAVALIMLSMLRLQTAVERFKSL